MSRKLRSSVRHVQVDISFFVGRQRLLRTVERRLVLGLRTQNESPPILCVSYSDKQKNVKAESLLVCGVYECGQCLPVVIGYRDTLCNFECVVCTIAPVEV